MERTVNVPGVEACLEIACIGRTLNHEQTTRDRQADMGLPDPEEVGGLVALRCLGGGCGFE